MGHHFDLDLKKEGVLFLLNSKEDRKKFKAKCGIYIKIR